MLREAKEPSKFRICIYLIQILILGLNEFYLREVKLVRGIAEIEEGQQLEIPKLVESLSRVFKEKFPCEKDKSKESQELREARRELDLINDKLIGRENAS